MLSTVMQYSTVKRALTHHQKSGEPSVFGKRIKAPSTTTKWAIVVTN